MRTDLRAHPREQVNRRAKVLEGSFAVDALIKDISVGGARLVFPGRTPSREDLVVVDIDMATAYACEVVWRKGPDFGVRILKSQDLRGLVSGQFDPARRVWQASR
jgi:hypothetical protein